MIRTRLRSLTISRLRIIDQCELDLSADLVVFAGPNGSGKTTVLEAIHLLATGRSFRSRSAADLVQRGSDAAVVGGSLTDANDHSVRMGIEKRRGGSYRLRINGEPVTRLVELARRLPLVVITPDSQRLLTDGSEGRRRLIDWLLFHVEPQYSTAHARYRQALRQRNALIRDAGRVEGVSDAWDVEVMEAGTQLQQMRAARWPQIAAGMRELLQLLSAIPVEVALLPGWPADSESLEEAFARSWQRDLARGFTNEGPHRADLEFRVDGRLAKDVLSRGESKLLTVGIQVALARLLAELRGVRPVVLVDELASELDERSRGLFFGALQQSGSQTLITTVDAALVQPRDWASNQLVDMREGRASAMVQ